MTRFTGGGGRTSLKRAASNYVGAKGGARNAARAAASGRAGTARLGGFLADVLRRGIDRAARELGLTGVVGRAVDEVFAAIANAIAPDGATLESAAARAAIDEALAHLYERYVTPEGDAGTLDSMDADAVRDSIRISIESYVYTRWLEELSQRIEVRAVSAAEALRLEREVKDYVRETVRLDLGSVDVLRIDWAGSEGRGIIDRLYREAYDLLEASE
ncbi:Qat anti-phage system associated protein QatB [Tautonia sociabilis]|uniref:Uncharacterized protein n=1 Tax=Tautonia sociabilis TaxID=2080755 RepID=A0A432MLA2_9BACT|nr:Qat anti-phage system associated protein QatB [Tautonia sociabilis]RUL87987.1 hypothetical protein TsocGM_09705 [Tautonia sociabilis]